MSSTSVAAGNERSSADTQVDDKISHNWLLARAVDRKRTAQPRRPMDESKVEWRFGTWSHRASVQVPRAEPLFALVTENLTLDVIYSALPGVDIEEFSELRVGGSLSEPQELLAGDLVFIANDVVADWSRASSTADAVLSWLMHESEFARVSVDVPDEGLVAPSAMAPSTLTQDSDPDVLDWKTALRRALGDELVDVRYQRSQDDDAVDFLVVYASGRKRQAADRFLHTLRAVGGVPPFDVRLTEVDSSLDIRWGSYVSVASL